MLFHLIIFCYHPITVKGLVNVILMCVDPYAAVRKPTVHTSESGDILGQQVSGALNVLRFICTQADLSCRSPDLRRHDLSTISPGAKRLNLCAVNKPGGAACQVFPCKVIINISAAPPPVSLHHTKRAATRGWRDGRRSVGGRQRENFGEGSRVGRKDSV